MGNNIYNETYFERRKKNEALYYFLALKLNSVIKRASDVKILEIGCGKAEFVSYLFEKSFFSSKTHKVILSDLVPQRVKYPFIEKFEIIDAEKTIPYNNEFDLILAIDVIEHIANYKSLITNIHSALKNDGVFFFTTPNVDSFKKFIFGRKWCGYEDTTHIILHDKFILKRVLLSYFKEVSIYGFTQIKQFILQHQVLCDYLLGICRK